MNQKWDERYQDPEFAYGKEPNLFFKEWLPQFEAGAILMPADGEGRNGVFAAQLGWNVTSVDLSVEGQAKALQLAQEKGVALKYLVGDVEQLPFERASFDAIGLIYAHFSAEQKPLLHRRLTSYLKPGGILMLEAFSKRHLEYTARNPKVGGPKEVEMLYAIAEIRADFGEYDALLLEEKEIFLNEGKFHLGTGSVIRFVGKKQTE